MTSQHPSRPGTRIRIVTVPQHSERLSTVSTRRKYRDVISKISLVEITLGVALPTMSPYALSQEMGTSSRDRGDAFVLFRLLPGVWVGLLMLTTGILGVCTYRKPSYSVYVANLVLSVITVVLAVAGLVICFTGAALVWDKAIVLHVLVTIGMFFGLCAEIAHAIFAYKGIRRKGAANRSVSYSETRISTDAFHRTSPSHFIIQQQSYGNSPVAVAGNDDCDPPPPYPHQ